VQISSLLKRSVISACDGFAESSLQFGSGHGITMAHRLPPAFYLYLIFWFSVLLSGSINFK
jgi:hypothetical protein